MRTGDIDLAPVRTSDLCMFRWCLSCINTGQYQEDIYTLIWYSTAVDNDDNDNDDNNDDDDAAAAPFQDLVPNPAQV